MKLQILKKNYILISILILAAAVRFTGITWAFPFTPHPDEWNMAAAITRLDYKISLDPKFYAYGQFPLYLSYFSAVVYNLIPWIKIKTINTQEAFFFLRFWSALAGVGIVYLVYLLTKKLVPTTYPRPTTHNPQHLPLLAALLAAFTPGLIQFSHFGTTESLLSFFLLAIVYFSVKFVQKPFGKSLIFAGLFLGLALGTKISAATFAAPISLALLINLIKAKSLRERLKLVLFTIATFSFALSLGIAASPYLVLEFAASKGTLLYETRIATGEIPVFYTRQFINTSPILFQLQKIFPYALGWPIFVLGIAGFFLSLFSVIRNLIKNKKKYLVHYSLFVVHCSFLAYFLSQAFLFCKWTRFMAPTFAFFPIFASFLLIKISFYLKNRLISKCLYLLIFVSAIVPGIFFSSIYFQQDIRFTASEWIYKNIPSGSAILYDTGNVVDIPISSSKSLPPNPYRLTSISFDFYHLDENPELFLNLIKELENSEYIIVPSRRIFMNHLRFPEKFPLTAKYYELLFSGRLGFVPVTKIEPFYSKIFNDEKAEETFTVFDHPTIRIYKKIEKLNQQDYEKLFEKN